MKNVLLFVSGFLVFSLSAQTGGEELPINDITERRLYQTERALPYPSVREADIMWETRVWRVIDTREKMNLPFRYPQKPFATLLIEGVESGELQAYSVEDDDFSTPLSAQALNEMIYQVDTLPVYSFETGREEYQEIRNELNPEDIKRYRIKEHWWFDTRSSSLRVRILGIAPLIERYDEQGNLKYETPLFWIYYPHARPFLANCPAPRDSYHHNPMSWADLLDMRKFSSHIIKASNVHGRRLEEVYSGVELLQRAEMLEQELFSREHDVWSY
ncbi:MAG TPA: gliding motility protein GldN [Phaeodactylibacter sp.]|nr:gliding motility protein GldN [Phaeodactylibacter sp.]